jgi:hypothetical protein
VTGLIALCFMLCSRERREHLDPSRSSRPMEILILRQWSEQAFGWPFTLLLLAASVATLWAARVPGGQSFYTITSICLWVGIFVRYFSHLIVVLASAESLGAGIRKISSEWHHWMLPAIVFMIVLAASTLGWSRQVAFRLSRSAMEHLLQHNPSNGNLPDQWIGAFFARDIEVIPEGMRFKLHDAGSISIGYGFAFFPGRLPPPSTSALVEYEHWDGPWYVWRFLSN